MARYINPFSDWSFKRIFGQEYSKDLLIEFLNQLLLGEQHITDVKFKDKEMLPEQKTREVSSTTSFAKLTQVSTLSLKCKTGARPISSTGLSTMHRKR